MELEFYALTHSGIQRTNNEDYYAIPKADLPCNDYLFVVADGMGGHKAGEIASELATRKFAEAFYQDNNLSSVRDQMNYALEQANNAVYHKARERFNNMGTTLVACHVENNRAIFLNVGDSRAYIIRNESARQITIDHSVVNDLILKGVITEKEAVNHPQRNVITKAIGIAQTVKADFFVENIASGDYIVLCSDGLTNHVDLHDVGILFNSACTAESIARSLLDFALIKGGADNITIIVIRCK